MYYGGFVFYTFAFSFVLSLVFEVPILSLEKILLRKEDLLPPKKKKEEESTKVWGKFWWSACLTSALGIATMYLQSWINSWQPAQQEDLEYWVRSMCHDCLRTSSDQWSNLELQNEFIWKKPEISSCTQ